MAETAALLADEVLPALPLRQWVISFPFALRFLFASRPDALAKALSVIYRLIATHLAHEAGFRSKEVAIGAVTLVQRFGSALNLDTHLHMLCLDGVYASRPGGGLRFDRVKAPEREELEHLVLQIAERVGRALERMGLSQRDAESACLEMPPSEDTDAWLCTEPPLACGRGALGQGPQAGRKALVPRTITALAGEEPRRRTARPAARRGRGRCLDVTSCSHHPSALPGVPEFCRRRMRPGEGGLSCILPRSRRRSRR